jgi:hypothetical protein
MEKIILVNEQLDWTREKLRQSWIPERNLLKTIRQAAPKKHLPRLWCLITTILSYGIMPLQRFR